MQSHLDRSSLCQHSLLDYSFSNRMKCWFKPMKTTYLCLCEFVFNQCSCCCCERAVRFKLGSPRCQRGRCHLIVFSDRVKRMQSQNPKWILNRRMKKASLFHTNRLCYPTFLKFLTCRIKKSQINQVW